MSDVPARPRMATVADRPFTPPHAVNRRSWFVTQASSIGPLRYQRQNPPSAQFTIVPSGSCLTNPSPGTWLSGILSLTRVGIWRKEPSMVTVPRMPWAGSRCGAIASVRRRTGPRAHFPRSSRLERMISDLLPTPGSFRWGLRVDRRGSSGSERSGKQWLSDPARRVTLRYSWLVRHAMPEGKGT